MQNQQSKIKAQQKYHEDGFENLHSSQPMGTHNKIPIIVTPKKIIEENYNPAPFSTELSPLMKTEEKSSILLVENRRLKIINKELKKQLEIFEKKLDETLKKRTVSQKKPRVPHQIIQNMQLKNAYKQCQIYKREIIQLKKKQSLYDEQKIKEMIMQIAQFNGQKQKLLEEIKSLKKVNRIQEKGLMELTDSNYTKIMKQLEQLKEQNKKLNEKIAKEEREKEMKQFTVTNEKRKQKQAQIKEKETKKKQQQKNTSQIQILKAKIQKDNRTITFLLADNKKSKQVNEQLKATIQEKDREINALRERLASFRKQMRYMKGKLESEPAATSSQTQSAIKTFKRSNSKKHLKQKSQFNQKQQQIYMSTGVKKRGKYPRLVEAGTKKQDTVKWNHHQFSSKIKQVQISPHPNGHIKEINFRYEKGEPQPIGKGPFAKFCCEQNSGEFVRNIKGGFKDELLRYVTVQTNKGRISHFGQHQLQSQCITFSFGDQSHQFLGAFFGENSIDGVNRIGCLIESEKQK